MREEESKQRRNGFYCASKFISFFSKKKKVSKEETARLVCASKFIFFYAKRRNVVLFLLKEKERKRSKKPCRFIAFYLAKMKNSVLSPSRHVFLRLCAKATAEPRRDPIRAIMKICTHRVEIRRPTRDASRSRQRVGRTTCSCEQALAGA